MLRITRRLPPISDAKPKVLLAGRHLIILNNTRHSPFAISLLLDVQIHLNSRHSGIRCCAEYAGF